MVLAKSAILRALESGALKIDKIDALTVQPASIDLRLGSEFYLPDPAHPRNRAVELGEMPMVQVASDIYTIPPQGFILARTAEVIELADNLTGFVEGRSSVGRGGLTIHNAGWVDPGFRGSITLELFNALPVPLTVRAGRRIAQVVLVWADGESGGYHGKYQGQVSTTPSRFYNDEEVQDADVA